LGAAALANAQVTFFNDGADVQQDLPFSESVRVHGLLFVSGQVGTDVSGKLVDGGIQAESRQVMENIRQIVQRRGLTMRDIVKCTVFLADVSQWGDFNKIYTTYFSKPYPARSALGANGLALGAALEVECIAAYPQTQNHG
jgi:reactive intermediate/imine deaminase